MEFGDLTRNRKEKIELSKLERRKEENLQEAASPHAGAGTLFSSDALALPDVLTTQRVRRQNFWDHKGVCRREGFVFSLRKGRVT